MILSLRKALLLTVTTSSLLGGTAFANTPADTDPTQNPNSSATHPVVVPTVATDTNSADPVTNTTTHHTSKFVTELKKIGHEIEEGVEEIGRGVKHLFQKSEKEAPVIEADVQAIVADAAAVRTDLPAIEKELKEIATDLEAVLSMAGDVLVKTLPKETGVK